MLIRLFPLLLVLSAATPAPGQQAVMSNDYWLSFLPSTNNEGSSWLLITSQTEGTRVQISYSEVGSVQTFLVNPDRPLEYKVRTRTDVPFPYLLGKPDTPSVAQRRSMHVTSSDPISVQQFTDGENNVSLSLPIPTNYLGRKYVVLAFNDQPPGPNELTSGASVAGSLPRTSGGFVIVAAEDSTQVGIVLSAKTTSGSLAGDSIVVSLQRGQTYWIKGLADSATNDLTGSIIASNNPIAVVSGAEAMHGLDKVKVHDNFYWNDHIAEYLIPVEQWGTEYIGHPLSNKAGTVTDLDFGELFRVVSAVETIIHVNGIAQPRGRRWDIPRTVDPVVVTSETPISVGQYDYFIHAKSTATPPRSANSMQLLTPRHQWVKSTSFDLPTGYAQTYVYVTAHKDSIDKVTVFLPGRSQPIGVSQLKYSQAQDYNFGEYRTYTLITGTQGQLRIQGPCQFQALNHGTRDDDLSIVTYGYAASVGSTFGRRTNVNFAVKIDSNCYGFELTLEDTAAAGDGIADVLLLNGPFQGKDYLSKNFKLVVDPHAIGAKLVRAAVNVANPLENADAFIAITMRDGASKVISLKYSPPYVSGTQFHRFGNVRFGDTICVIDSITNRSRIPLYIDSFGLSLHHPSFQLFTDRSAPLRLDSGMSLRYTICYTPVDTGVLASDSILFVTDCFSGKFVTVEGFGSVAVIFAEDQDFKVVAQGEMKSETLALSNLSSYVPLVITGFEFSHPEFTIDPAELSRFPIELSLRDMPGSRAMVRFNYQPLDIGRDTAVVIWKTDIHPAFGDTNRKEWSVLTGQGSEARSVDRTEDKPVISVIGSELALDLQEGERVETIRITDVLGKTRVYQEAGAVRFDQFEPGVYFIEVVSNERRVSQKIVR